MSHRGGRITHTDDRETHREIRKIERGRGPRWARQCVITVIWMINEGTEVHIGQ